MRLIKPLWETAGGRSTFVRKLPRSARVLDVGCGNNSPAWFKSVRPDLYYVGLDVGDYNQQDDVRKHADEYIVCGPEEFAGQIEGFKGTMDAVVCSHNLEHCDDPARVLVAMAQALKPGGSLYLSFPCEASVGFPKRAGCLNFFDDHTHKIVPSWAKTVDVLATHGCRFQFLARRYRPFPLWIKGLLMEPISALRRAARPDGSTWALYGFESVIIAVKE